MGKRRASLRRLGRLVGGHRRWWVSGLVLVVVAAGVGTWLLTRGGGGTSTATTTATVASQTETQTVAASGTIDALKSADDEFEVSGTVSHVLVHEGAQVTKGQVLARVDDTSLVAARSAALATYDAAVTQRDDDEDADADDTQLAADQTAIVTAHDSLVSARRDVRDAVLTASIAGTVTSVGLAKGDVVSGSSSSGSSTSSGSGSTGSTGSTGTGLPSTSGVSTTADTTSTSSSTTSAISIVSTNRFILDSTVAATDVDQVTKGLQATITVTGVDDPIYGTVTKIGAVASTDDSGAAVFPVTITVTGTRTDLYAGTSGDATITVKQTPNVLVVPTQALHGTGSSTYVEKVVDGKAVKTSVTTGTVYGAETQVTKGLSSGDVVQLPSFTRTPTSGTGGTRGGGTFPSGGFPGGSFPGGTPPGGATGFGG